MGAGVASSVMGTAASTSQHPEYGLAPSLWHELKVPKHRVCQSSNMMTSEVAAEHGVLVAYPALRGYRIDSADHRA